MNEEEIMKKVSALDLQLQSLEKEKLEILTVRQGLHQQLELPIFKEFFEKHSEVLFIAWHQGIPEWNDGEECVFRRGDIYVALKDAKPWVYTDTKGIVHYDDFEDVYQALDELGLEEVCYTRYSEEISHSVKKFLERLDYDLDRISLIAMFGEDEANVFVDKHGFEVNYWESY